MSWQISAHKTNLERIVMANATLVASYLGMLSRIEDRTARVGVVGLGYVGLPLTLLFSEQRFQVTGFDIDRKKIEILSQGGSYIYRIPTTDIQAAKEHGFRATCD